MRNAFSVFFAVFFLLSLFVQPVQAGFGISPPYVRSSKPILPGAHYEQRIMLLRSSSENDLQAKVTINAPGLEEWISIDKGDTFDLPQGELQVPMVVNVDVPEDAEIGDYTGHITVRIVPKDDDRQPGVAIALGARIDIDLEVTNEQFIDFNIRKVDIHDLEVLKKPWSWKIFSWLLYKINVDIKLENTGNVETAPSKVELEVYDLADREIIATYVDKSIKKVDPQLTDTVTASFATDLEPGQYWGHVKIFKDNDIVHKDKMNFTVYPNGKLPGGTALGAMPWIMLSGYILIILTAVFLLVRIKVWKYLYLILYIIFWPLTFSWKKLRSLITALKVRFWKWVGRKASKYERLDQGRR